MCSRQTWNCSHREFLIGERERDSVQRCQIKQEVAKKDNTPILLNLYRCKGAGGVGGEGADMCKARVAQLVIYKTLNQII